MNCPHCNAEVFVSDVLVRCLRCSKDISRETIPEESVNLSQESGVSTVGFMEEPLDTNLKGHFKTILLMLAEGKITEYEMISGFEVNKFEDFLRKNRINYLKRSVFSRMKEPSYLFSLSEEE